MKNIAILIVAALMLVSCEAQTNKDEPTAGNTNIADTLNHPKIDYKVDKKYDENGNLVEYDSVYTYYYSNIDKKALKNDSIFEKFSHYFNQVDPFFDDDFLNQYLKEDSNFEDAFFSKDFFDQHFRENEEIMNQMLRRMDSLKNQFFIETYPLEPKVKKKKTSLKAQSI